jgi:hypothetical protein
VAPDVVDKDFDGIDAGSEKDSGLNMHHFTIFQEGSAEEQYLPTDVLTYIKGSSFINRNSEES